MKKTIGGRIKQLRNKLPYQEFADLFGVSPHTIMRYESGKTDPSSKFIIKLCDYYKISPNWLLYGDGSEQTTDSIQPPPSPLAQMERTLAKLANIAKSQADEKKPSNNANIPESPSPAITKQEPKPNSLNDSSKLNAERALDLSGDEFEGLWLEFWREKEARRGWLQIEVIKRFPEFVEWLEQRPVPLNPAQIAALKKDEPTLHYGLPGQLNED